MYRTSSVTTSTGKSDVRNPLCVLISCYVAGTLMLVYLHLLTAFGTVTPLPLPALGQNTPNSSVLTVKKVSKTIGKKYQEEKKYLYYMTNKLHHLTLCTEWSRWRYVRYILVCSVEVQCSLHPGPLRTCSEPVRCDVHAAQNCVIWE